eukprot:4409686-Pleurochrysis_carterae.AAC.4
MAQSGCDGHARYGTQKLVKRSARALRVCMRRKSKIENYACEHGTGGRKDGFRYLDIITIERSPNTSKKVIGKHLQRYALTEGYVEYSPQTDRMHPIGSYVVRGAGCHGRCRP